MTAQFFRPNYTVTRLASGNFHATWFLEIPVHRGRTRPSETVSLLSHGR